MIDNKDDNYREKRRVERKYLVFYLRVFDGMSINVLGHIVNLSSQGIMLLSDRAIAVEKEYLLRMKLPEKVCDRGELLFQATSCWSKKDANPDFFLTGFQIHDLAAKDKNDILGLLDEFSFLES